MKRTLRERSRSPLGSRLLIIALALLALGIAGCGSSSSSSSSSTESTESTETAETSETSEASEKFPTSLYPAEIYEHVESPVVYFEPSGGAIQAAKENTVLKEFQEFTGVPVQVEFAESTKLNATLESGQTPPWNVIQLSTTGDFYRAEEKGELEKLDTSIVPIDEMEEGTADEYGYGIDRYGTVLAYNTEAFPNPSEAPTSMVDLFNTKKYPGKRCMFKYPEFGATFEAPLLADGVKPDELYPLDTKRAFEKLDTIKNEIVWWNSGDESIRDLSSGECSIGITWTGRVYSAIEEDEAPVAMTWGDGMTSEGVLAIPKGAQNPEAAQAFLGFWLKNREGQKDYIEKSTYPTPLKEPIEVSAKVQPYLPQGENLTDTFPEDGRYYSKHLEQLSEEFTEWLGS